jgi:hypothetical protein
MVAHQCLKKRLASFHSFGKMSRSRKTWMYCHWCGRVETRQECNAIGRLQRISGDSGNCVAKPTHNSERLPRQRAITSTVTVFAKMHAE